MTDPLPFDHERLLAEIDEEVRRRRASGDLPPDFERELDLVFARFAPAHVTSDDFEEVLESADQLTFIDPLAPVESSRPLVPQVKRVVRKTILWEVRHVAQQVSGFAHAISRAVRLLGDRVQRLERLLPDPSGTEVAAVAGGADVSRWAELVAGTIGSAKGRVAVADAGDGSLLAALAAAGVDAYGVDPADRSYPAGLEVRVDTVLGHLRALPSATLAGLVLWGSVDRLPPGAVVELAALAAEKLAPAGRLVVLARHPSGWGQGASTVEADLSPGRPLHPDTWRHLLNTRSFVAPDIREDGSEYLVVASRPVH